MRYRRLVTALLGSRTTKELPSQVAAAVEEQENRGEILVKVVQLVIAGVWGLLYLIAPGDRNEDLIIVPFAIGIYLLLNGVGLVWATRRRLPDWSIYFSIVFDIALLYLV